jgi:hypothetical protein
VPFAPTKLCPKFGAANIAIEALIRSAALSFPTSAKPTFLVEAPKPQVPSVHSVLNPSASVTVRVSASFCMEFTKLWQPETRSEPEENWLMMSSQLQPSSHLWRVFVGGAP